MDIVREDLARNKRRRLVIYAASAGATLAIVTIGSSQLEPSAPSVDRSTVIVDTVRRGPLLREVRGSGTLVPVETRQIAAATDGRVERILLLAGTAVSADTVILELTNPAVQQVAIDAELQLRAAEAELTNRRVELQSALLNQRASAAGVKAAYEEARLRANADAELARQGIISELTYKISKGRAEELATRHSIEQERLEMSGRTLGSQLSVQQARVDQFRALHHLQQQQLATLKVRAGIDGIVQQVPVQVGQRVTPGILLARVVQPQRLKAELRIAETQARDLTLGQTAAIDTRNGVVAGRVIRIDPASQNGTVTVDVALDGDLPRGARPDLSVDGTIELERLPNVLYVGRPVQGSENSTIGIFKLSADEDEAKRTRVVFGRSSVNAIEVRDGLKDGDRVILSEMSAWDAFDRVRLK